MRRGVAWKLGGGSGGSFERAAGGAISATGDGGAKRGSLAAAPETTLITERCSHGCASECVPLARRSRTAGDTATSAMALAKPSPKDAATPFDHKPTPSPTSGTDAIGATRRAPCARRLSGMGALGRAARKSSRASGRPGRILFHRRGGFMSRPFRGALENERWLFRTIGARREAANRWF